MNALAYMKNFLDLYGLRYQEFKNTYIPLPEKVQEAFLRFPRHLFFPLEEPEDVAEAQKAAENDVPIPTLKFPVGHQSNGAYIITSSQPTFVLLMLAYLELGQRVGKILEVGCGSGWVSAMLSHVGKEVFGVDVFDEACVCAMEALEKAGCENVEIVLGEQGTLGLPDKAPFDRILVSCGIAIDGLPKIQGQLTPDGIAIVPVRVDIAFIDFILESKSRNDPASLVGFIKELVKGARANSGFCVLVRATPESFRFIMNCSFVNAL